QRLLDLAPNTFLGANARRNRRLFTTDSYDFPNLPVKFVQNIVQNRLSNNATHVPQLVAPAMRMGLPLDLNRPFGNERDDSNAGEGNGAIDSLDETNPQFNYFTSATAEPQYTAPLSPTGEKTPASPQEARERMARYLYVLMLSLDPTANTA